MEIKLKRRFFGQTYTIGSLYIDGVYFCDTLEDKNRDINKNGKFDNGEMKVYALTCIPFGKYKVVPFFSPKFQRYVPRLLNVPSFEGILMHRGNTERDTAGCIIVGENKIKGQVINSAKYEIALTAKVRGAFAKGDPITIEIV